MRSLLAGAGVGRATGDRLADHRGGSPRTRRSVPPDPNACPLPLSTTAMAHDRTVPPLQRARSPLSRPPSPPNSRRSWRHGRRSLQSSAPPSCGSLEFAESRVERCPGETWTGPSLPGPTNQAGMGAEGAVDERPRVAPGASPNVLGREIDAFPGSCLYVGHSEASDLGLRCECPNKTSFSSG